MRTASIVIVPLLALLAGCTSAVEEFLHEPQGQYAYYDCELLARVARENDRREGELRHMMNRAAAEPGGAIATSLSFRNEYSKTRAYKKHFTELMQQKNCKTDSLWSSEREVR
jgi:hypothetical protein